MPEIVEGKTLTKALTESGKRKWRPLTPERKRVFLEELRCHGVVAEAARVASPHAVDRGGARSTFIDEARRDPVFAAEMQAAQEEADSKLLMEARRRAIEGTTRGIFQKGGRAKDHDGKPASEQVYSDRLLELLLKARFPSDFIERRSIEHSTAPSGWMITASDLHALSEAEVEQLQKIMSRVMAARGEIDADPALEHADVVDVDSEEIEGEPELSGITDGELKAAVPW